MIGHEDDEGPLQQPEALELCDEAGHQIVGIADRAIVLVELGAVRGGDVGADRLGASAVGSLGAHEQRPVALARRVRPVRLVGMEPQEELPVAVLARVAHAVGERAVAAVARLDAPFREAIKAEPEAIDAADQRVLGEGDRLEAGVAQHLGEHPDRHVGREGAVARQGRRIEPREHAEVGVVGHRVGGAHIGERAAARDQEPVDLGRRRAAVAIAAQVVAAQRVERDQDDARRPRFTLAKGGGHDARHGPERRPRVPPLARRV